MQLNDYKINRKLFKFTNNIDYLGRNKYLSRESSINKVEQSIYKSLSSSQLLSKTHRANNHNTNKIQEISVMGSIYNKDSAYFNSIQNDLFNIPPIRSLNKDDGDKLIASLNQQIKQQKLLISKLNQQISIQSSDIDNLTKINLNLSEKQSTYDQTTQDYNDLNYKIQQIAEIREMEVQYNDYYQILTQLYSDDYKLQIAIKWRNQRLCLNLFKKLLKAFQISKFLNKFNQNLSIKILSQYYYQWRRSFALKKQLFQFNQVKQFRIIITYWKKWKNKILFKSQLKINFNKAIEFYSQKLKIKYLGKFKKQYLLNNYQFKDFNNIYFSTKQKLGLFQLSQCFRKWQKIIQKKKQYDRILIDYQIKQQLKQRKKIIRFLYQNLKFYQHRNQTIIQNRRKKKIINILAFLKEHCKSLTFKREQIKSNRNYFIKYYFWKKWIKKQNKKLLNRIKSEKIINKRQFKLILQIFITFRRDASKKKQYKQNIILINQKYCNRISKQYFIIWLKNLLKQQILLGKELSCCISQLKDIESFQSSEVFELNLIYQNKLNQLQKNDEEINNYKLMHSNQNQVQQELKIQQYIFILYFCDLLQKELISYKQMIINETIDQDELQILREQKNLIEEQIQGLKSQNCSTEICSQDLEKLKLQLEMNKSLFQEQQEKYIELQKDYSKIVNDYERRIQNLEIHYLEQSQQQRTQIQNIQNNINNFGIYSNRHHSQPEFSSETKQPNNFQVYNNKINYNTQNSPEKETINQLIQDETTITLREDIKRRLAYLKCQMDQHN